MFDFWKKKSPGEIKLSRPKTIPDPVGRFLVVKLGQNPDWVWNLKSVVKPRGEEKNSFDVRVFDSAQQSSQGVTVKNYNSLDEHPELILFDGWFNKKTQEVHVENRQKAK